MVVSMAVGDRTLPLMHPVAGIRLATVMAGIRREDEPDLVVIEMAENTTVAAAFTRNRFRAAPVRLAENHLQDTSPRYLLVNTGNANAGTGAAGEQAAQQTCEALAAATGCSPREVLPYSTGVIGELLPVAPVVQAIPLAVAQLSAQGWAAAADGIRTTDLRPKGRSVQIDLPDGQVTITGIAKGSGMIRPNMATMLAFIATDARIEPSFLQQLLSAAVAKSFNRITVDGDTSTNDACTLMATGASGVELNADAEGVGRFIEVLEKVFTELAQEIVADGEGATRLVSIVVSGARNEAEAEAVGFVVAESPLVKTALFAGDPNWGRILAAVGRAPIESLDVNGVAIAINGHPIAIAGGIAEAYDESVIAACMAEDQFAIEINLGRGVAQATVWTCDLSYDYVRINAEYRS